MTEPDVALTDYAVAIECAIFSLLLARAGPCDRGATGTRRLFTLLFASTGIAAAAGGTVHGFFLDDAAPAGAALWRVSLLALGLTSFAAASIGGRLIFGDAASGAILWIAGLGLAGYAVVVLAVSQRFWIAIAGYAPSVLFLGAAFLVRHRRRPDRSHLAGLAGVALTIAAAVVQQLGIGIDPAWFNHNALYHLIQMVALALLFIAGRHLSGARAAREG
jgi:hypothetical protein